MDTNTPPQTLVEAIRFFRDRATCLAFLAQLRWPDGHVACPTCGRQDVRFLSTRFLWECKTKHPRQQFSIKVGTIFEDSPISLDKWLVAVWLLANCKNGVSSYELARDIKVTQKTAWFMLHRIRLAMQTGSFLKLGGPGGPVVEVDETWIGGKARSMTHKRRGKARSHHADPRGPYGYTGRAIVMGMLERGGKVVLRHVKDIKRNTLLPEVVKHVAKGTEVHTDELHSYQGLVEPTYAHKIVNHTETYVAGNVHTNGIENFWSLLKRGIRGTYVSVEPFHLFRYLDEQAFRFNGRKGTDALRFTEALRTIIGRRLTYAGLTGATATGVPQ